MLALLRVGVVLMSPVSLLVASPSAAIGPTGKDESRLPFTVVVETVREDAIGDTVVAAGTVAARRELPVGAEAEGLAVVAVHADEGDRVRKGDVLARLNRTLVLAQRTQARAAVAEAEANLANAEADAVRARKVAKGVVSRQTIDERERLVKTGTAKLASARAALDETEARLAQTDVLAPADGIVAHRGAAPGQVVQPGGELFRLIEGGLLEANALVPEAELFAMRAGQPARVVDAAGQTATATVRRVAPTVDAVTRLGTVRVALPEGTALLPGMFVRVEIDTARRPAVIVPLDALVFRGGGPAVFVATGGTARLRPVTPGRLAGSVVEIVDGVAPGEVVVTDGAGLLEDGEAIVAEIATAALPETP